nr:YpiB family protein [Geobacillus sp. JS12]
MTRWVSYSEKRQFLTTFLQQHRLKHPDARFVLQYLLQHPICLRTSILRKPSKSRRGG